MTRSRKKQNSQASPLANAFDSFNASVEGLGSSYQELKERIQELNVQISEKNKKLEENFYEVNRLRWFFDSILNSMTDGVIVVDTSGRIVLFNGGAEKLTGFTNQDVLGKTYTQVFGSKVSQRFSPLFTLTEGLPLLLEEKEIQTKSGKSVPVRYSTSLVSDSQNRTLGAVEVLSNLTHTKRLEKEMQQIKTQSALSQMACLMAHEIRNPLGGIRGYVDLIAESFEKDDPRKKMVDHILKSILRLDEIVANFQLFTRPVKPHFEEIDLSRFLADVLTFFQDSSGLKEKSIQLVANLDKENQPIRVRIDPILLEQCLLAVLDNAVKAMNMGGVIRVELAHGVSLQKRSEKVVSIIITDSGEGISKDVLKELFMPFYTTREKGLGLGLSMARNFISLQRGDIFVESEEGMGTTVTIVLPLI
jgi:two-component system sensor histidine kinase AtoS